MTVDGRITPSTDDQFRITNSLIIPGACLVFFGAIPRQLPPDGEARSVPALRRTRPQRVPHIGSSHRPALADSSVTQAWKGARDDQGIYWSRLRATGLEAQQNVRGVGTSHSPALVLFQNSLFMFWKGIDGDSRVYYFAQEIRSELERDVGLHSGWNLSTKPTCSTI